MEENKQYNACQYLYATIRTAEWISEDYKNFAEKYKDSEEILKELYLCICDQVSLDVLELVELNESVADAFKQCRKKHLESDFLRKYTEEIKRIKRITTATEKEVKNMSGTIKQIADSIPALDERLQPVSSKKEKSEDNEIQEVIQEDANVVSIQETDITDVQPKKRIVTNRLVDKVAALVSHKTKGSPAAFVDELYSKNYSDEQIAYIIDCLEEGMKREEILKFAFPSIPVSMMKKLKQLQQKERGDKVHG